MQYTLTQSVTLLLSLFFCLVARGESNQSPQATPVSYDHVPGIVINHSPKSSGLYIGSPSIAVLNNGDYFASHDFFGPKSGEHQKARSLVFRSADRGQSWEKVSEIQSLLVQLVCAPRRTLPAGPGPAPWKRPHPAFGQWRGDMDLPHQ